MASTRSKTGAKSAPLSNGHKKAAIDTTSKAFQSARHGIKSSEQFAQCMSDLIADLATGRITPEISNAMVNAGGKLLKIVEMTHRYGRPQGALGEKRLRLSQ